MVTALIDPLKHVSFLIRLLLSSVVLYFGLDLNVDCEENVNMGYIMLPSHWNDVYFFHMFKWKYLLKFLYFIPWFWNDFLDVVYQITSKDVFFFFLGFFFLMVGFRALRIPFFKYPFLLSSCHYLDSSEKERQAMYVLVINNNLAFLGFFKHPLLFRIVFFLNNCL